MKRIYLIHGWGGNSNSEKWFSWMRDECEKRNIELIIPNMPNTKRPKIEEWMEKLNEIVDVKTETYLIGHSIGCQAIMRFLEQIKLRVKGVIFIAGRFNLIKESYEDDNEKKTAKPWIETKIDFNKVKNNTDKIIAIFSDNDPYVSLSETKIFKEKLGAEIIIKRNEEHFNDTEKIEEVFNFIK